MNEDHSTEQEDRRQREEEEHAWYELGPESITWKRHRELLAELKDRMK